MMASTIFRLSSNGNSGQRSDAPDKLAAPTPEAAAKSFVAHVRQAVLK
jgi:hypothetical protein